MAKSVAPTTDIAAAVTAIQTEHAATADKAQPPLTGVEVAAIIAGDQPPAPNAGQRYRIADRANPVVTVDVVSPDGSIEDAVRSYNHQRTAIRTAKQLIIQPLSA